MGLVALFSAMALLGPRSTGRSSASTSWPSSASASGWAAATGSIDDFFLAGRADALVGGRACRSWPPRSAPSPSSGTTGQAYTDGMRFLVVYFGLPFAMVILCVTLVPFFYRARVFTAYEYLEKRFDGAHPHPHQPALPALARALGRGHALRAVPGALRDPRLERAGHHPADGRHHDRLRGLRRQQVGDLDRRGADGHHLVRDLPVPRRGDRAAARRRSACGTPSPWPRPRAASRSWTPRLEPRRSPTPSGAASSAACFLALAYFGCDQSQVQRYLSGSSLTREPAVPALQRLPQGPDAVPDPAHRRRWSSSSTTSTRRPSCGTRWSRSALEARAPAGGARARSRPASSARTPSAAEAAAEAFAARAREAAGDEAAARVPRRRAASSRRRARRPRVARSKTTAGKPLRRHQLHLPDLHPDPAAAAASPAS